MSTKKNPLALTPQQLTRRCDPKALGFKDTGEIAPERTIYGQPRGVRAIEFGIDINSQGYNIYVLGPSGSGRVTAIRQFINQRANSAPTPDDWCYVYNFRQEHKPRALRLRAGLGRALKTDMAAFIETLRGEIPTAFDSEPYRRARTQIANFLEDNRERILNHVQQIAAEHSFVLQTTPQGVLMMVALNAEGEPIAPEQYESLPESERAAITDRRRLLESVVEEGFRQTQTLRGEAETQLENLRRDIGKQVFDAHLATFKKKYADHTDVLAYFDQVRDAVLEDLEDFEAISTEGDDAMQQALAQAARFRRFEVNTLVEHTPDSGAPVVFLDLPTYRNLVGRIEHEVQFGVLSTDFTLLRGGALHQANGGFLIMRALDILQQPFAWDALKRALNTEQIMIEDAHSSGMSVMATKTPEPDAVPLQVTVVLVGGQSLYYQLHAIEPDFPDLFRVKADFGETMRRTPEAEQHYATFVATRCHEEKLPPFKADAVARIVEYGSWLVADQQRLSTQFGLLAPLVREAAFFGQREGHKKISAADVQKAIDERTYRNNELEELAQDDISDGIIFIDLDGAVVGQINGLVVMAVGDHSFGLPSRITARVYMGRDGIVQIDRETQMTGSIHDKGVMILQGYLGGRYAQEYPLSLSATITFEQNYGEVEGDSASSTELYALLSALSDFPLRQDLAVTGSVNQRGAVQPIGGVTQKVEGFFSTCKRHTLTGTQGVIIPKSNVQELMLNDEVIQAVKDKQFHIYAVETVDEGMALLTGKTPDEIHEAVDARLRDLAKRIEEFSGDKEGDGEESEEG